MRKIIIAVLAALALPVISFAQTIDSSLNANGKYTTGTDSQFDVQMNNYQSSSDLVSVLTIADSKVSDVKQALFLDKSGWVKLTPFQRGSDVLAKFISDTGFTAQAGRAITLRVNFNTAKTYIIGFALENSVGQTISSAAAPMTVSGKVLGESTPGAFTRSLTYGSKGPDVSALQTKLTSEGFYSGPITGTYGRQTQAAVKKYQASLGIPANGVVGPQTLAALNQ